MDNLARSETGDTSGWVIPGILPNGVTLLSGSPRSGKSWLVQTLAVQVSQGDPIFGQFLGYSGDVLLLSMEDGGMKQLIKRLDRITGKQLSQYPMGLTCYTEYPRYPECGEKLESWVLARNNARLIVVDCLETFTEGYSREATLSTMEFLGGFSRKWNIGIVVTHHDYSKTSIGLASFADCVWLLGRSDRSNPQATLAIRGYDLSTNLNMSIIKGLWTCNGKVEEQ